jgi:hypothetical protein
MGVVAAKKVEGRAKTAQQRLAECPSQYLPLMRKALSLSATRSQCIKAMCLQCMGYEKREIRECKSWACPLWSFRPYQPKEGASDEA